MLITVSYLMLSIPPLEIYFIIYTTHYTAIYIFLSVIYINNIYKYIELIFARYSVAMTLCVRLDLCVTLPKYRLICLTFWRNL